MNQRGFVIRHVASSRWFTGWNAHGGDKYPIWGDQMVRSYVFTTERAAAEAKQRIETALRDVSTGPCAVEVLDILFSIVSEHQAEPPPIEIDLSI